MHIPIIVGSVMGTAEAVAKVIDNQLCALNYSTQIVKDFDSDGLDLSQCDALIVCCSNTGMGDLPANIVPFYTHLTSDFPKISGLRYGLISLGDSSYPNFAQAGKTMDEAFIDLGAQRLGEHHILDAIEVNDYTQTAKDWVSQWEPLIRRHVKG